MSDGSDIRSPLTIERCKITNTPAPSSKVLHKRAISIEIQDNKFKLINNFISSNRIGGIEVKLAQSGGSSLRKNFIYGNTFSFNANGALSVSGRKSNQSFVYIVDNAFDSNLGHGSTLRLTDIQSEVVNNFFYNNSGLYTIEFEFSGALPKEQKCQHNTFFLNKDIGQNYGVTIMSNGPMEYYNKNLKNPYNLYELSSTRQAVTDPILATQNWWGTGIDAFVGLRIYENDDDYRLGAVQYKPFKKLPPRNILSSK